MEQETIITPISAIFFKEFVPDLLDKSFDDYKKNPDASDSVKVSDLESAHSAVAIVLTVLSIEAHRNRIFYFEVPWFRKALTV